MRSITINCPDIQKPGRSRPVVVMVSLLLVLQGCSSTASRPQVVEPVEQAPPAQNVEMVRALGELSALKEELKLLRNRVEEIQFNQENSERRQQDLIQDFDRRLNGLEQSGQEMVARLETLGTGEGVMAVGADGGIADNQVVATGQTGTGGFVNDPGQGQPGTAGAPATGDAGVSQVDTVTVTSTRSAAGSGDGGAASDGSSSVSLNEQDAYDAAFDALKQSRYQDAISQFQSLVNTWPDSGLADDALYWMSEARYVNREFESALNGFRDLVQDYPDSSRVPEAMLKIGYIQYDIGAYDQAAKTFEDILARFPGHQVTVSAETRLRRIKQTIQ
jgi:tol-pal system protein YbgF